MPWDRRPHRVRQKLIDDARAAEEEQPLRREEMMRSLYGSKSPLSSPRTNHASDTAALPSPPLPQHRSSPSSPAFLPAVRSSFSSLAAVRTLVTASSSPAPTQPAVGRKRSVMAPLLLSPVAAALPVPQSAAASPAPSSSPLLSSQLDRLEQLMAAAAVGSLDAFSRQRSLSSSSAGGTPVRRRSSASVTHTQQLLEDEERKIRQAAMRGRGSIVSTAAAATQEAQGGSSSSSEYPLYNQLPAATQHQQMDAGGARYGRRRMQSVVQLT